MSSVLRYGYRPADFAPGLPDDPVTLLQTTVSLSVTLARSTRPVQLHLDSERLLAPVELDGQTFAAGDRVELLWTLVDDSKDVRITAHRLIPERDGAEARVVLSAALPLTAGQPFALSLPTHKGGIGIAPGGLAAGTRILTGSGKRPIEDIAVGDTVWTQDDGFQPVLWHGVASMPARGQAAPLRLPRGTLGVSDDLVIAGRHHICVSGQDGPLFVPATAAEAAGLARREFGTTVNWHHVLLARHAVILANGLAVESLFAPDLLAGGRPDDWPSDAKSPDRRLHPVLNGPEAAALLS